MRFGAKPLHFRIEMGEDGGVEAGATGNIDGIDAEALMGQIERGESTESPAATTTPAPTSSKPAPVPAQSGSASAPAAAGAADPIVDLTIDGKVFKAPLSRVKQWASLGRNYGQLVERFNAEKSAHEQKYKLYEEIDAYAQKNPDWWKTTQAAYQNRSQSAEGAPASAALSPETQAKLDQLDKVIEFQSRSENEQAQKALDAEVQDVRTKYPDLSWDTLDENGTSLELRIIDHALKNGIQSFKTAFRDLMHDDLVKYHADKAKEAAVKEHQAQRKNGLIGVSTTSQRATAPGPQKFKNYEDAANAALAELGVAQ